jgi:hypothetical protein
MESLKNSQGFDVNFVFRLQSVCLLGSLLL